MPVIPQVSQGIELGLNFTPSAPPEVVATIKQIAQTVMAASAIQPMVPPMPVMPVGAAITYALMLIEAMLFKLSEIISQIIIQMQNQYNQQLQAAQDQRETALEELFQSELTAQEELVELIQTLRDEIAQLQVDIQTLKATKDEEFAKYNAKVMEFGEIALQAQKNGDQASADEAKRQIYLLEPWLDEIIKMIIEITNKNIELRLKNIELEQKLPLSELQIQRDWEFLESYADDFEVAIPNYPDMPDEPNYPRLPPIQQIPEKVKAYAQAFAKWVTAPQVPPIGIVVSTVLKEINAMVPKDPLTAAQTASIPDSLVLILGGAI